MTSPSGNGDSPFLIPSEAAAYLRCAMGTLENLRYRGVGPAYVKTPTGRILYRRAALDAWLGQ